MNFLLEAATTETTDMTLQNPEETIKKASALVEQLKNLIPSIIKFGINVIIALIIFWIGKVLINIVLKICKRFFERTKMEVSVSKFLNSLIKVGLYIVLISVLLETVGIKTTSFVAVLGTASLAIGLSIQGSLSNFAGGVLILILKPFVVGDYIIESGSGKEGTVYKIDLFYTTLITLDNKKTVIPNGNLSNTSLTNVTAFDTRRVDFEIGISYDSDIKKAREILEETAKKNDLVIKDKEIFSYVANLDASQVTLGLRVWAKTSDYWKVKFDLTEAIKNELDANNIEIPFNQLVVHVEDSNANIK
ncbi:MAG: mechanosensitive ion channel [Lachnospiraceae bacterium]|nr:mechanosensitive ion channel [Clostridiales bacterium]MDD6292688.1 mechanosensitive ion channel [Eubacteriales bacterium]MDY2606607.1 mechanosensitive ion channel [Lachnospiraceae bacterium]